MTNTEDAFQGKAIIFSAPSGAGKTTIVQHLMQNYDCFGFSISATTRDKRPQELDRKDYYFLSPDDFRQKIDAQAFIEWEEVYENLFYGTLESEIERLWAHGKHILFDVDVQGGLNLKKYFQEKALAIFVTVPTIETLAERLKARNTESSRSIEQRLAKYEFELSFQDQFDRIIVNETLDNTLRTVKEHLQKFLNVPLKA